MHRPPTNNSQGKLSQQLPSIECSDRRYDRVRASLNPAPIIVITARDNVSLTKSDPNADKASWHIPFELSIPPQAHLVSAHWVV